MKLTNRYFKVETKRFSENHNHIEKDFFKTKAEAENCFKIRLECVEHGFLQNRYISYSVILAECDTEQQITQIHKTRKAPL